MKEIKEQVKLKYLLGILVGIFTVLYISYRFIKPLVSDTASLSIVFFILGSSLFLLSFTLFYLLKKQNDELIEDVEELSEYILDISHKKYTSSINIKYYAEFLQISLYLKNVIKRLNK